MRITIIATGGTIASTEGDDGLSPSLDVAALLDGAVPDGVQFTARQVLAIDSAAMGPAEMRVVSDAIADALAEGADAVVVLHGTDTMEETALLAELRNPGAPVVFTGAMRGADHPEPDGPANILGAIEAARTAAGVGIFFAGRLLPVWGTRKAHTAEPQPYETSPARPVRVRPGPEMPRVDIVALYPGADAVAIDALVAAGAEGLVLEAMGAGNANAVIVGAVRAAVAAGVPVLVTTRVAHGLVSPSYGGGGGGADLVAAGAILSPRLRAAQTRILLAELLSAGATRAEIRSALAETAAEDGTP